MKRGKKNPEVAALELALARMAERAVHAEARVKEQDAEIGHLKYERDVAQREKRDADWSFRTLWLAFWIEKGARPEKIIETRVRFWGDRIEEARQLVNQAGKVNYQSPDEEGTKCRSVTINCPPAPFNV